MSGFFCEIHPSRAIKTQAVARCGHGGGQGGRGLLTPGWSQQGPNNGQRASVQQFVVVLWAMMAPGWLLLDRDSPDTRTHHGPHGPEPGGISWGRHHICPHGEPHGLPGDTQRCTCVCVCVRVRARGGVPAAGRPMRGAPGTKHTLTPGGARELRSLLSPVARSPAVRSLRPELPWRGKVEVLEPGQTAQPPPRNQPEPEA